MIPKLKSNHFLLVPGLVFFGSAVFLHRQFERPQFHVSKQETAININSTFLRLLSVGNKRLLADLFWITTLLESDLEKYQRKDSGNWMFLRFRTISMLDPKFYQNYLYGGQYLSIVKDDLEGAAYIYEKGLQHYPDDFKLNLNAGFNYFFELGDYEKGLPLLDKIKDYPQAPVFLPSVVNKLKLETGYDTKSIYLLILERFEKTEDPYLKEKLRSDLYALKAEIDLECLNAGRSGCERRDFEGVPYQLGREGRFKAGREFHPYRLRKKKKSR